MIAATLLVGVLLATDTAGIFAVAVCALVAACGVAVAISDDHADREADVEPVESVEVLPGWAADWHRRLNEEDAA